MTGDGNRRFVRYPIAFSLLLLTGCGRAPAVDILGSFFPAWLICLVVAILFTAVGRFVLLRFNMNVATRHLLSELYRLFHIRTVASLLSLVKKSNYGR